MAKLLEGKVAIVTGAGRGLGRGEALAMAKEGAKLVVNDFGGGFDGTGKAAGPAEDVCKEIRALGGEAVPNFADVTSFQETKELIETAIKSFGKLNILVNNAGILRDKMFFNMEEEDWDKVIGTHLKGTFNCSRHACAYFREQHKAGNVLNGKVVNTASDAGLYGNVGQTNYGAAKAAIAAFTIILSREMARSSVSVNCVVPVARTRLTTDATPSMKAMMEKTPPPGEFDMLAPENMAPLVVFFTSDLANDITGEVCRIIGDTVYLLRGWRDVDQASKGKAIWTADELSPVIHKMVEKAGVKPDLMTGVFSKIPGIA
jgi:NAD(P)-dependent dehydrogenase (short-subunit alcohol dehydrogenase family)